MTSNELDAAQLREALGDLRQQIDQLGQRVAALEQATASQAHAPAVTAERLSEETVLAISAAIAAYLGKKPRIRQIRLLGSPMWAQHGRATIQASHALNLRNK